MISKMLIFSIQTTMKVEVRLFGIFNEHADSSKLYFEDIPDTNSLIKRIFTNYPSLEKASFSLSVNQHIIGVNTVLADGDEVALMPAFSGG